VPETEVVFFRDEDGESPILGWLDSLPTKVQDKCTVRIERLAELRHEMRRPEADYLSGGIYELRCRSGKSISPGGARARTRRTPRRTPTGSRG
jgi:phage-related protein